MDKRFNIGPIVGKGANKTAAREHALECAAKALDRLEHVRPVVIAWRGQVSIVRPVVMDDGKIQWMYTNPRTLAELVTDCGRESMGSAGYWDNASLAGSAVLSHMIQIDDGGIPDELPDTLHPKDVENLVTLRGYQRQGKAA